MLHYKQEMYWKKKLQDTFTTNPKQGQSFKLWKKKVERLGLGRTGFDSSMFLVVVSVGGRGSLCTTGSAHKRYLEYVVQLGGVVEIVRVPGHVVHLELQDQGIGH